MPTTQPSQSPYADLEIRILDRQAPAPQPATWPHPPRPPSPAIWRCPAHPGNRLDGVRRLSRQGQTTYHVYDVVADVLG